MMAVHKPLHELLTEDQEPFHLNNFIATKQRQLTRKTTPSSKPAATLHLKKRKPANPPSFCNHACFFSFQVDSPDVRKSPLFRLQSPAKSPNKVILHIPARTAAMLLDAAIRIQKHSTKPKELQTNSGFGLFGSLLKRFKDRSGKSKKRETCANASDVTRELSRKETVAVTLVELDDKSAFGKSAYETGFSCSCNNSRLSSAGWSESNEEKSLDLETSCSSRSDQEDEFVGPISSCEKCFCASPVLSPFRFSLLQSPPSPGRRTPDFLSPVASPSRHDKEDKEICEIDNLPKDHLEGEEEKEQCSPVSVLDPLFEDDDDEEQEAVDDHCDDYDRECSYANVQRAKQQLLQKLRRFERLADLDPVELEKRMFEQEEEEDDDEDLVEEEASDYCNDVLVRDAVSKSSHLHPCLIPSYMKRLVSDLICEENNCEDSDNVAVTKRVCKRLDSWKEVESNTIDMMVELDFGREVVGWKGSNEEQIKEAGMEIEVAIFGLLVEELAEELINMDGH